MQVFLWLKSAPLPDRHPQKGGMRYHYRTEPPLASLGVSNPLLEKLVVGEGIFFNSQVRPKNRLHLYLHLIYPLPQGPFHNADTNDKLGTFPYTRRLISGGLQ